MSDTAETTPQSEEIDEDALNEKIEEAVALAKAHPESGEAARQALFMVVGYSKFPLYKEVIELVSGHIEFINDDADAMLTFGFAAWVVDPKGLASLSELSFLRALKLNPQYVRAYQLLTIVFLTSQRWDDAFSLVINARKELGDESIMAERMPLIERLRAGVEQVNFEIDGVRYDFALSCFNGQAVEADVHHCIGRLVEHEELQFLKEWLPSANKIVECGCLVGNHTVYFLKNLKPKVIDIYDASERSISETAKNIGLNDSEDMDTVINCNHRAIGKQSGESIELFGENVETISLSDAIDEETDFVKIDIDGMEDEALDGLVEGLKRSGAYLMIEVKKKFIPKFEEALGMIGYTLDNKIVREADHNLFFAPKKG